jgi:hypothetical protein
LVLRRQNNRSRTRARAFAPTNIASQVTLRNPRYNRSEHKLATLLKVVYAFNRIAPLKFKYLFIIFLVLLFLEKGISID